MIKTFLEEKEIKKLKETLNLKYLKEKKDFETLRNDLLNKNLITNIEKLFKLCFNINNKTKIFLTTFMILQHSEEIFQKIGTLEKLLINKSETLINEFERFLNDEENQFKKLFEEFNVLFETWKKNDLNVLLLILSSTYTDLDITLESLSHEYDHEDEEKRAKIWREEIKNQKRLIEQSVSEIVGEKGLEDFLEGKYFIDLIGTDYQEKIVSNLKKAYFEKIKMELNDEKTPYTIIKTLKEIREKLNLDIKIEILNQNLKNKKEIFFSFLEIILEKIEKPIKIDDENFIMVLEIIYEKINI